MLPENFDMSILKLSMSWQKQMKSVSETFKVAGELIDMLDLHNTVDLSAVVGTLPQPSDLL